MKWETKPFDSLCDEITVGFVGTMATYYADEGVLFLRSQNIEPFKLNLEPSQMKFITPEFHSKLRKSALKEGDIAIVRTGYPGTACVIPSDLGEANCADLVIARPHKGVDSKFVCYFINSPLAMAMIGGSLVGSAQKHFNVGVAKRLEIPCPPLPTQQKIASILSTYDDLIENNLKRIRLLEEAAQCLYREWFVQFRFPGWEEVKFVDGLPEGWERKKLGEVTSTIIRGISPKYVENDGFTVINQKCIRNQTLSYDEARLTSNASTISEERILKQYDILVNSTGLGTLGRIAQVLSIESKQTVDSHVSIVRADKKVISPILLGFEMKKQQPFISGLGKGSTNQTELSRSELRDLVLLNLPPMELQLRFEAIGKTTLSQIFNLQKQNRKLKEARDILLPRLMNQTIEV